MAKKITIFVAILLVLPSLSMVYDTKNVTNGEYECSFTDKEQSRCANSALKPHVVVAIIDSGINVYHEVFRRPNMTQHPSEYIEGFPEDVPPVTNLTFGGYYWTNIKKDEKIWESLSTKKLYWFPYTNIIGISFEEEGYPILPETGGWHGTSTSSIISMKCHEAIILMIESDAYTLEEAFSWAVEQSWIDIILPEFATWEIDGREEWSKIPEISKRGVENGKIIIAPAGNRPWHISLLSNVCGMPWVINVGGVESYSHGATIFVSKLPDYVSNYTEYVAFIPPPPNPYDIFNFSYRYGSGTSISTPVVVSAFASIILKLRQELNYTHGVVDKALINIPERGIRITNWDIRNVVNHTAIYWRMREWRPGHWPYWKDPCWLSFLTNPLLWPFCWIFLELRVLTTTRPISSFAPWLQMGWGFVNESIVDDTVDILLSRKEMPEKPEGAVKYMEWIYHIRQKIWEEAK
ncbi:MAG: S8/S53 family peptidase [Thermoplasmata archaeon]|nr:MAG: S8/S53 family peptidase [Thermoplasmata archaeon]